MGFARELQERNLPIFARVRAHPFVRGIGDGTLPVERFRYYIEQDYVFLVEYSRVLALAVCGTIIICFLTWLAVNRHLRLVRSYAEVESIVAQRTQELERANQELLHSQKMRALGTLAAGIAHDFNNILSIIKGSTQIIEANLDDKEKIRTRADRIKTMVEQGSHSFR